MTINDYLSKVLASQSLGDESDELKTLQGHRADVEKLLCAHFKDSSPTIRYAGSKAKGTMNRESYDLDIICYFASGDSSAGDTLQDIYKNTQKALEKDFLVEPRGSALRLKSRNEKTLGVDFHIDVVPGRFTDDSKTDVFLYQSSGDKERLKTNLDVHIKHVKESGVIDAIRLAKLWKVRNGLPIRTFVLELAVIKLLKEKTTLELSGQMEHLWKELRDNSANLCVEDPANPNGNDLSKELGDDVKSQLASTAKRTLTQIDASGWEAVFGEAENKEKAAKVEVLRRAASVTVAPTRPWLPKE